MIKKKKKNPAQLMEPRIVLNTVLGSFGCAAYTWD